MGANFRPETLLELTRRGNLAAICACGHRGVLDGRRLSRYFMTQGWNGRLHMVGDHLRCSCCGRRRPNIGLTFDLPRGPRWGPRDEGEWQQLMQRARRR